jgi:hypothetical protein
MTPGPELPGRTTKTLTASEWTVSSRVGYANTNPELVAAARAQIAEPAAHRHLRSVSRRQWVLSHVASACKRPPRFP